MTVDTATFTPPAVGDRVRALAIPFMEAPDYVFDSMETTVTSVGEDRAYGTFTYKSFGLEVMEARLFFREWEPVVEDAAVENTAVARDPKDDEIEALKKALDDANRRFTDRDNSFARSIEIIGSVLIKESNEREWCEEFDRLIGETNEALPGPYLLEVREREYVVSWVEDVIVSVPRSMTLTAFDEDDAREQARNGSYYESIHSEDIKEAVSMGSWETMDSCDTDYEVELA
jgi:hypothetical protein